MAKHSAFKLPSRSQNTAGQWRNIGFELEFTGLDLTTAATVVAEALSGHKKTHNAASAEIEVENLGRFVVELDWNFLKQKARSKNNGAEKEWLGLLSQAASLLVPMEVVCPPIPVNEMEKLDVLIQGLRQAGAVGTEDSLIAAYGIHINAESPSLKLSDINAYVRAFALLQWWLVDEHQVDLARRISPYVDLYPEAYLQELLTTEYISMPQFIDSYLKYNASRNRALDMLPLLAQIDPKRVRAHISDPKIKARPTFHYRLPNCQIDKKDWFLAQSWNTWWIVEELANMPQEIEQLGQRFLSMSRPLIGVNRSEWIQVIRTWIRRKNLL